MQGGRGEGVIVSREASVGGGDITLGREAGEVGEARGEGRVGRGLPCLPLVPLLVLTCVEHTLVIALEVHPERCTPVN